MIASIIDEFFTFAKATKIDQLHEKTEDFSHGVKCARVVVGEAPVHEVLRRHHVHAIGSSGDYPACSVAATLAIGVARLFAALLSTLLEERDNDREL